MKSIKIGSKIANTEHNKMKMCVQSVVQSPSKLGILLKTTVSVAHDF